MIPRLLRFGAALMCANSSLVHAQPLAAWHFNLERLSADSGYAELETGVLPRRALSPGSEVGR
jgi:hypothetical protein